MRDDAIPAVVLAADPLELGADLRVVGVEAEGALERVEREVDVVLSALPDLDDLHAGRRGGSFVGRRERVVGGGQLLPGGLERQVVVARAIG